MNLPRSILVPVDFGEASARAVAIAGALGNRCGAALRVLHVESAEAPAYFTSAQIETLEGERRSRRRQADDYLKTFTRARTDHAFSTAIEDGSPIDVILRMASDVDLVAMGTHGRHGPSRWWLGSVAERVLRGALTPLLVVRAGAAPDPAGVFDRVVVHAAAPLDGRGALEYARALAALFGGSAVDRRYGPIEPAMRDPATTLLAVATPGPNSHSWLTNFGEPLVRYSEVPIVFVPESNGGSTR